MAGTELIGRIPELTLVDALLTRAAESPAVLEIAGAAGIGKTSLWAHARRLAESRGFTVLSSRPTEAAAKSSFGAVADLIFPIGSDLLQTLPQPQRDALEVALLRRSRPRRGTLHRAVAAGLLALVRELASTTPLLIAIDDWQWLDGPSRDALEFAARRLEREPVRIVYSLRTPTTSAGLGNVLTDGRFARVSLSGLELSGVARLVTEHLGQTLPRPLLVRVSDSTAGNPFHVLELARALVEHGSQVSPGAVLPVPENLRELLLARVAKLPRRSRDALALVAALAQPSTFAIEPAALVPAEEAAIVDVELDGRVLFTHPLLAATVDGALTTAQRRQVHAHAAELVDDPEQRARHLALAAIGPDAAVAAQLDDATALAERRGAPDAGAELAELAADLTPSDAPDNRAERLGRAAGMLLDAGDLARAHLLLEQALQLETTGAVRSRVLQISGQLAGRRHDWFKAAGFAADALELAAGEPALLAGIECDLAFASASIGNFPAAVQHGQAAATHAALINEGGTQAIALAVLTMVHFLGGGGLAREQLARAVALEDPLLADGLMMRPRFISGLLELWTGHPDHAAETLESLQAELIERGQDGIAPMAAVFIVWAHLWRGDFPAAALAAARATDTAALLDDPGVSAIALAASALVHAHDGRSELARAEAQDSLTLFARLRWGSAVVWTNWALGVALLGDDDPEAVHALLGPLVKQLAAMGPGDPVVGVFIPDEVEALLALGRPDDAEAVLDWFEDRARVVEADWALAVAARCRGAIAATRRDTEGASAAFQAALAAHDRCPIPFERARTLLVSGRCLRRAKRRRAAVVALDEAIQLFTELGAAGWAARAREERERVGRRVTETDALTESERLIAELAASGLTNREVAERAFVSVKTVEANLTRAYRKLGVRSRVGLAKALQA